jgi:hypothetical protein
MRSGKVARALSSKIPSASLLADMPLWHCDIGSHVKAKAAHDRGIHSLAPSGRTSNPRSGPFPNLDKVVLVK